MVMLGFLAPRMTDRIVRWLMFNALHDRND
jgi:hypothetical protein